MNIPTSSDDRLEVDDLVAIVDRTLPARPMIDLYSMGDQMTLSIEEARGLKDWLSKVVR